jgi:hypothetical protein
MPSARHQGLSKAAAENANGLGMLILLINSTKSYPQFVLMNERSACPEFANHSPYRLPT